MPKWAQTLGGIFPFTNFLRIARGIMFNGSSVADIVGEIWPIAIFAAVALAIGVKRYRRTLD